MKSCATAEPERAQMTIFYAGQVIVFNEFPADKAKEVMLLASKGTSQSLTTNQQAFASNLAKTSVDSTSSVVTGSSAVPPNLGNKEIQEHVQPPPQPLACGNYFLWLLFVTLLRNSKNGTFRALMFNMFLIEGFLSFFFSWQSYQLQGELHSTGSWRRGKIGRHFGI